MMAMKRWPFAIVAGLLLAGCASVPSGPIVMALPGSAKSADDFRADDAACRQTAAVDAKAPKKWRYDMTYLQCMYAKGNQIPAPSGMFAPATAPAPTTAPANQPAK
ncbi:MAG: glycine zipper family protein [Candidatus Rokuibacteriota bacterium]|nr:MAG: glycine zipper family protein [Candidatus Rokubacteria bacterium]